MGRKPEDDTYSDEEAAKRRDATIRAMIATPPKPHQLPTTKGRPALKGRAQKGKSQS
jgi:hypothetical protein